MIKTCRTLCYHFCSNFFWNYKRKIIKTSNRHLPFFLTSIVRTNLILNPHTNKMLCNCPIVIPHHAHCLMHDYTSCRSIWAFITMNLDSWKREFFSTCDTCGLHKQVKAGPKNRPGQTKKSITVVFQSLRMRWLIIDVVTYRRQKMAVATFGVPHKPKLFYNTRGRRQQTYR